MTPSPANAHADLGFQPDHADIGFHPDSAKTPLPPAPPEEPGILSRLGEGVYDITVGPLVHAYHDPGGTAKALVKQAIGKDDLDKIADAVKAGDYKGAALHLGSWVLSRTPEGASLKTGYDQLSPAVENVKKGNFAGAAGNLIGTGAMLAAPAAPEILKAIPDVVETAAKAVPRAVEATGAAVKAAAPGVASGAAMVGAGELAAKLPGMELPARLGISAPGARMILAGAKKGLAAGREVWNAEPPPVPEGPMYGPEIPTRQQLYGDKPTEVAGPMYGPPAPTQQELWENVPTEVEGPVHGPDPAPIAAQPPEAAPAPTPQLTPGQALAKSVGQDWAKLKPTDRSLLEDVARAQQNANGKTTATQSAATPPPEPALAEQTAPQPPATPQAAISRYLPNGDLKSPEMWSQDIINWNVEQKAQRVSQALFNNGITAEEAANFTPEAWRPLINELTLRGQLKPGEVPPNLSLTGVVTNLKKLQSQKLAQDLAEEMRRSGTLK